MARPHIFISSTFYDLRNVREDIARAMRELGYEVIRNEAGAIPYTRENKLEVDCYREINNCDILVCIIGNRFGANSNINSGSITQNELRTAYESGKQVYIFVEKNVLSERRFFNEHKEISELVEKFKEKIKIYSFIDEVESLPTGNPLFGFETSSEIIYILKEQLAGLFQRLLSENSNRPQINLFNELKSSIATVGELVNYLSHQATTTGSTFNEILLTDHPLFNALRNLLNIKYRIYFINLSELDQWLSNTQNLEQHYHIDDFFIWFKIIEDKKGNYITTKLKISKAIFDDNTKLIPMTRDEWKDNYIIYTIESDELPF